MSGSNVWTRSRERLRLFPELFAQCTEEVSSRCLVSLLCNSVKYETAYTDIKLS